MDSDCISAWSSKRFSSFQWLWAQNYNKSLQSDLNRPDCAQHRIGIRCVSLMQHLRWGCSLSPQLPIHLPSCSLNVAGIKYSGTCFWGRCGSVHKERALLAWSRPWDFFWNFWEVGSVIFSSLSFFPTVNLPSVSHRVSCTGGSLANCSPVILLMRITTVFSERIMPKGITCSWL